MTVTNMKYYITQGGLNWADEIDFEGFDLFTEDQLKDAIKAFSKGGEYYDKSVNAYLGTNEDEEVSSEDVLYELKEAEEITEALQGGENPTVWPFLRHLEYIRNSVEHVQLLSRTWLV